MGSTTPADAERINRADSFLLATWWLTIAEDRPLASNIQRAIARPAHKSGGLLSWLDDVGGAAKIHAATLRVAAPMSPQQSTRLAHLVAERISAPDLARCMHLASRPEDAAARYRDPELPENAGYVAAIRRQASHAASVIQNCRHHIESGLDEDPSNRYREAVRQAARELNLLTHVVTNPAPRLPR